MATVAPVPYSPSTIHSQEDRSCAGCHKSVEIDTGGIVVAFGNSLWHVDCFKCAKCGDRVSADTNLLLLSDGSPVCSACTYNCAVCKTPISDEAIMTGDESYHAACFTCKTCGRHIGELVFAKTTQGIYCMSCHNDRVARSRRHAEQRRNRSKPRRDLHRDKDKDKMQETYSQLRDSTSTTNDCQSPPDTPGLHNPQITSADSAVSYAAKRVSTQSIAVSLQNSRYPTKSLQLEPVPHSPNSKPPLPSPTITTTHAPTDPSHTTGSNVMSPSDPRLLFQDSEALGTRSKSFEDRIRPSNGLSTLESGMNRIDKRFSDNLAIRGDWSANKVLSEVQLHQSPTTLSPMRDVTGKQQPQHPQNRSRDSDGRSPSPYSQDRQRGGHLSPSPTGQFYSPPPSPFLQSAPYSPFSGENPIVQTMESTVPNNHQIQTLPALHHKSSNQHMSPARTSSIPSDDGDVNGIARNSTPQQSSTSTPPRLDTSARELPRLPTETEESSIARSPRVKQQKEEFHSIPLALPPMSFSDSEISFNDLLKLGTRHSMPSEEFPKHQTYRHDDSGEHPPRDDFEAGPSNVQSSAPSTAGTSSPETHYLSPPTTKTPSPIQMPLNNLPKRSASLVHRSVSRKPVLKAIVLPDNFQANASLFRDDSFNGPSTPRSANRTEMSKTTSELSSSSRRPASAGSGSFSPLSQQTKARRSSDNPVSSVAASAAAASLDSKPSVTFTDVSSNRTARPVLRKQDASELILKRMKETLTNAEENGASNVRLDREFLEVIYLTAQATQEKLKQIQKKFDGMRRASQQFIDGLTVAQEEYDRELAARREAEAEVTRLKIQLSGQAAQLTKLSAEVRKREVGEQMSRDLSANLDGLERDLSRVMAERDLAVAEVEELAASKMTANHHGDGSLQRSLTNRFDNLKSQYKRELEPLLQQREALLREINELKEERNICLEETTALNARNEELAKLNAQTTRQSNASGNTGAIRALPSIPVVQQRQQQVPTTPKGMLPPSYLPVSSHHGSTTSFTLSQEEREEPKATPTEKKSKWFKPSREPLRPSNDVHGPLATEKDALGHTFQQLTVLRARCDHCGDKMWGTQLRCNTCHLSCHNRCVGQVNVVCGTEARPRDDVTPQPSMFGRDLREQVRADSGREHRDIPILVEKCIEAVELLAMDYEGVYRKSGGSAQMKTITLLFERGNYDAFDLGNSETFNDISSVTSVLKTYFRQLPNPLLTNALHEAFVSAASHRDPRVKADSLSSLIYQLPSEHFHTLRYLMLHLYRVQLRSSENLMNARNLGVVFGPTLMRSSDPNREFADMAGKALTIEWLVENAPTIFREDV